MEKSSYPERYNCENRLTDVNDANNSPVVSYKYDFADRRVRKIVHSDQVIPEFNGSNYGLRRFFYGPGIDEPVCMQRWPAGGGSGWFYYHFDGLGNVVAISNTDSNVLEVYEYDVYGQPTIWDMNSQQMAEASVVGNPYMFTGRRYDDEISLYYYRARYYNTSIGRFLQTDPINYASDLNLYSYCGNNPVIYTDPWGEAKIRSRPLEKWHRRADLPPFLVPVTRVFHNYSSCLEEGGA